MIEEKKEEIDFKKGRKLIKKEEKKIKGRKLILKKGGGN